MVITSAFLSQSLVRERENGGDKDCKCKRWKTFVIQRKLTWKNCSNQDIEGKIAASMHH